ncbi:Nucleoside-diphosphate-sugar epimerase [Sanguibacter gelidistatuariae]|uniref:Nucleoside-diphosphate-sugar epimerase n=1 Tax=Sanguibacter gelidistatuariae TaxID=1814289 RepID=A0A1G6H146_9MICO|nr:NAD-dependent epimerase/dehydratase family protein [Sanguibacter gelidistatuariae]SDB87645.1 Nucleoside-diphosphate-sugar epimerase [Sanguibacter gelidistatuariae]
MRAVVLGGTGAIGGATSARLADAGWTVDVTGRDPASMPAELVAAGVRFHQIERSDVRAINALVGDGAELLVDLLAYRGADVRALLPAMASATSTVLISSRAVYLDPAGRHINGDTPPRFPVPIGEGTPTLPPAGDDVDPFSREGYAPSKVAAENAALDSGLPVTVVRPSKVHGRWARNPRTRTLVEMMLRGDKRIELAGRGTSIDHLTAATNTAALIETVAALPGRRILNSADPGAPSAEQIVRAIATRLGWEGTIDLLDDASVSERGAHPWQSVHPIVLDTSAAVRLGYAPVGDGLDLLTEEIDWVAGRVRSR